MLSLLFFILAAAFNAVMDALENENFHESIFKKWNRFFWYKRESWFVAKTIWGYKFDGWHLAKSAMVVSLVLSVIHFPGFHSSGWQYVFDVLFLLLIYGILWNVIFWLFYHKLFKIK